MSLNEKHTWREVDLSAIKNNFEVIKRSTNLPFYTVVKANAYGTGAKTIAKVYDELGSFGFCTATFSEAMELRKAGITKPILILGYTQPEKAYDLFKNNLTQVVFSWDYARRLNERALYPVDCHIKLDSGMGRLGFDLIGDKDIAHNRIRRLLNLPNLKFSGMFSHFPVADDVSEHSLAYTQRQVDLFRETARLCEKWGFGLKILHGQNSAGIARNLSAPFNAVRAGIILYGVQPSDRVVLPGIKPVMKLKTIVTHTKKIKAGQYIGYGLNFKAERDTEIATLAAGYADGVMRNLGFTGHKVEIEDKLYPVAGNICMDQMMVDITGSYIKPGDEVTVIGGRGENSWAETAKRAGTIPHELMCNISRRVPRVYTEKGKEVSIDYGM